MQKLLTSLFAAALLAGPAYASEAPAAPATPAATAEAASNPIVCKKTQNLGSRLGGRKICATAAEWRELKQRHKDMLRESTGGGAKHGDLQTCGQACKAGMGKAIGGF